MTHIFYLHSNICSIVAYDIMKKISDGERIVVIANRGCVFNELKDRVEYFDATKLFEGERNHLGSLLEYDTYKNFFRYKGYCRRIKRWLSEVVNKEDFILYIPSYGPEMCGVLAENKYCQGYYFIEEGTMAYMPLEKIKNVSYNFFTKIGNVIRFLFMGIVSNFQLNVTKKFLGTYALSDAAFLWNKTIERHLVSGNEYLSILAKGKVFYDSIIIISYASYDISKTIKAIGVAYNRIKEIASTESMAVKLHPQSYFYYPDYTRELENEILNRFPGLQILPVDYSVEASIVLNASRIFSIFVRSSLSLYSLVLCERETYLVSTDYSLSVIHTKEEFVAATGKK